MGTRYGRWVGDVLIWTKAPFFFRNELVAADGLDQQRPAGPDEIKRLGDHPVIVQLGTCSAVFVSDDSVRSRWPISLA